jgi:sec-independent protein translocase protein TatA
MLTNSILLGILGGQELLLILILVLVLFGGRKIPELMRGLGRGVGEYNKAKNEIWDQADDKPTTPDTKKEGTNPSTPPENK